MKFIIHLLFAVVVLMSASASAEQSPAFWEDGTTYEQQCIRDTSNYGCNTFVCGLFAGLIFGTHQDDDLAFCPPKIRAGQTVDVLNNFIVKSAPINHLPLNVLAAAAWRQAWPCHPAAASTAASPPKTDNPFCIGAWCLTKKSAPLLPDEDASESQPKPTPTYCCKICSIGKACGNACISRADVCHMPIPIGPASPEKLPLQQRHPLMASDVEADVLAR